MLCEAGTTPATNINTKSKHYTVVPLTTLSGDPCMFCVLFAGVRENTLCETGLDLSKEIIGCTDNIDLKNTDECKVFPGGPRRKLTGKDIPCFCRWSEKSSITTEILREILATLDALNVYDCLTGKIPYVLLNGHVSRLGLPFLEYITNPIHQWCVVIRVPYGTTLWQAGDSVEQSVTHNSPSVKEKRTTIDEKEKNSCQPQLNHTIS